jgi:hypothetical protein
MRSIPVSRAADGESRLVEPDGMHALDGHVVRDPQLARPERVVLPARLHRAVVPDTEAQDVGSRGGNVVDLLRYPALERDEAIAVLDAHRHPAIAGDVALLLAADARVE